VTVVVDALLGAVVRDDVYFLIISDDTLLGVDGQLTQHVAPVVLTTTLVGNVGLDTEINQRQVLDRVETGVDAPDDAETLAMVKVPAEAAKLGAECWEGECFGAHEVAIQPKTCDMG
jgi:hypothetical protein